MNSPDGPLDQTHFIVSDEQFSVMKEILANPSPPAMVQLLDEASPWDEGKSFVITREQVRALVALGVGAERKRILSLLNGIDKDECENADGWWETSKGAEFGRKVVAAINSGANQVSE